MAHQFIDEAQFGGGYGSTGCTIETDGDIKTDGTITAASVNGITTTNIVQGPASATDNAVARFDLTTGKLIQDSVVTIADTTGNMAGVGTLGCGAITCSAGISGTTGAFSSTLAATGNTTIGGATGTKYINVNAGADGNASVLFSNNSVFEFYLGYNGTTDKLAIGRYNTSGVYQDDPISIAQSDGVTTLSKTVLFTGTRAVSATGAASAPENAHGTYTPTTVNTTNVTSSSTSALITKRVGNNVSVDGEIYITPTGAGACEIGIPLPVASAFTAGADCSGFGGWATSAPTLPIYITADATNDRAKLVFTAAAGGAQTFPIHFSYTVK